MADDLGFAELKEKNLIVRYYNVSKPQEWMVNASHYFKINSIMAKQFTESKWMKFDGNSATKPIGKCQSDQRILNLHMAALRLQQKLNSRRLAAK